jgi:hypothetical protein
MTAAELDRAEAAIRRAIRDRAEWEAASRQALPAPRLIGPVVSAMAAAWTLPALEGHLLAVIDEIRRHDAARRWQAEAESHWTHGLEGAGPA